jgi:hypothetical protein
LASAYSKEIADEKEMRLRKRNTMSLVTVFPIRVAVGLTRAPLVTNPTKGCRLRKELLCLC